MKLFQLLGSLSKEEFKLLRKAVLSPLFTTNEKVIKLYEQLRPQYPNFDASEEGRKKLFRKVFKASAYNDYKLRRLFSELTRVVEHFFVHLELEQVSTTRQKRLMNVYKKRGLYSFFKKETNDLLEELDKNPYQNVAYHWEKVQVLKTKYFHQQHDRFDKNDYTLTELNQHLDIYFSLMKLQLTILLKNKETILNQQFDYPFLTAIQEELNNVPLKDNSLLQFYLKSLDLVEKEKEVDFLAYEQLFLKQFPALDKDDKIIFYGNMENYMIRESNKANPIFSNELRQKWNIFGLNNGLFIRNGKMTQSKFGHVLIIGCLTGDFEMVDEFMETYKYHLDASDLENTIIYYEGIYHFAKKDFDKVLELYAAFQPPQIHQLRIKGITSRALLTKYLQDDSYYETLIDFLKSFEVYLNRTTYFPLHQVTHFMEFIKITRALANKINQAEAISSIKIWFKKNIDGKTFYAKNWLKEIIEKM